MTERIGIFGAGALGTLLATRLAAAGHEMHVVARSPARREALQRESRALRLHEHAAELPPSRFVFLCVKAYDTEAAALALAGAGIGADRESPPTAICSLQNGLGNMETLESRLPRSPLVAGATRLGAYLDESGALHASTQGVTQLAPWGATDPRWADDAAAILKCAGLEAESVRNAREILWKKLVLNAAVNPLPAIADRPNGVLLETPSLWRVAEAVADEATRVGIRLGCLPADFDPRPLLARLVGETKLNRGSMTEDLARGRPTEADAILGSIARAAGEIGETVPTLEGLWVLIREAEATRGRGGRVSRPAPAPADPESSKARG